MNSPLVDPNTKASHRYELTLICAMMVLYALSYQIQSPLEPFLIEKLVTQASTDPTIHIHNATTHSPIQISSAQKYAKLKSLFSVAQCICSFCFGIILDRWGVKIGLTINFIACIISYLLLYMSTSVQILYLSKVPGIAMAGYLCAQAAVVKLTSPGAQRIRWLGLITTAYTIGGTIGPYAGGILGSAGDYYTSALFASAGSLLCLFLTLLLPSSRLSEQTTEISESPRDQQHRQTSRFDANNKFSFNSIYRLLILCWFFIAIKFITCIVNSIAKFAEPVIFKNLGVKEQAMGKILGAQFAFGGFTNAFLITPLTDYLGGKSQKVIDKCLFMMALLYLLKYYLFAESLNIFSEYGKYQTEVLVFFVLCLSVFQYTLAVSNTNKTSEMVERRLQGTYLGIENAVFAVGFMLGPQLGFQIWQSYQIGGVYLTCSCLLAACFMSTFVYFRSTDTKSKSQ